MGRLVGRRFSGRVGSGIYVVKRISFCRACIVLTIELDHIGVVILGFVEKNIKR